MPRRATPLDPDDGPQARFALTLRRLRDRAGFDAKTIDAIAAENNIPRSTLYAAMSGKRMPTVPVLAALVRAWNGDPEEWLVHRTRTEQEIERLRQQEQRLTGRDQLTQLAARRREILDQEATSSWIAEYAEDRDPARAEEAMQEALAERQRHVEQEIARLREWDREVRRDESIRTEPSPSELAEGDKEAVLEQAVEELLRHGERWDREERATPAAQAISSKPSPEQTARIEELRLKYAELIESLNADVLNAPQPGARHFVALTSAEPSQRELEVRRWSNEEVLYRLTVGEEDEVAGMWSALRRRAGAPTVRTISRHTGVPSTSVADLLKGHRGPRGLCSETVLRFLLARGDALARQMAGLTEAPDE